MPAKLNLLGERFTKLLVLEETSLRVCGNVIWKCICECGNDCFVQAAHLKSGHTKSCGCLIAEKAASVNLSHSKYESPEYTIWGGVKQRCNNFHHTNYGGRGITYDPRWESFENFLEDMGERPSDKHTIERIDVNGNYCKENCIWTDDLSLQGFNQRKRKDNSSGRTGVRFDARRSNWVAEIGHKSKVIYLGSFNSFQDAVKAREEAELKYYGFNKE